ncbi:RagB/SusD family nutrient uptake outer membrane protein [Marivirga sp.]|uniref:RagB/SusD family nutrient uptake outer membrane protein n=1 Tax=Marivirga sp. TaxID=2018662 RepID=UPI0025E2CB27|nr:RagB/SusD family nutrient uptake outer membrane protein [Marivirga sp.]
MKLNRILTILFVSAFIYSCADLEIENPNEPNSSDVLASPADLAALPAGGFADWHLGKSQVNPGPALACNADVLTASWGNFGIRNFSWQPPLPIDNSLTSNDGATISTAWNRFNSAVSVGTDIENALLNTEAAIIVDGVDVTERLRSVAYWLQGAGVAHLSMLYDQGFIVTAETDLATLTAESLVDYKALAEFAATRLEEAAAIADANEFTVPADYINGLTLSSADFAKLARTIAAQALVLNARTPEEVAQTDWARVRQLTAKGIDYDLAPIGDGNLWFDDNKLIGGGSLANGVIANTWCRVDMKMMNLIDPSYPSAYPADASNPGRVTSDDARVDSDFIYRDQVYYPIDRGIYRFSNYVHNRYNSDFTAWTGKPIPTLLQAENDLMHAEALIRSGGDKTLAATLINRTRVDRGELDPLTGGESDAVLLEAVKYEKMIELLNTWGGRELAEARRWAGWMRDGAFRQMPIPASELVLLDIPIYTFGG